MFYIYRLFLILPEIGVNVMGTMWAFTNSVHCTNLDDVFSNTVVEGKKNGTKIQITAFFGNKNVYRICFFVTATFTEL